MEHKDPDNVSLTHLVLEVALDRSVFDPGAQEMINAVSIAWSGSKLCQNPFDPTQIVQEVFDLKAMSLVERDPEGGCYQVSPAGRERASVFRLRPDGTFVVFGSMIDAEAWPTFIEALRNYSLELKELEKALSFLLVRGYTIPRRITDLMNAASFLSSLPGFVDPPIPPRVCREVAVLACREWMLQLQVRRENLEVRARDRQVIEGTDYKLAHLQSVLAIPDLADALTTPKPRVTDFVNVGIVEAAHEQEVRPPRTPDEKFGILSAPSLFSPDFADFAEGAFARDRSFAVGFIDIDEFKDFNKDHLETIVDQDMLPYFMRALEAYCHGRAIAYRQGGDEYLVLLRNADEQEARAFFEGMRAHIAKIDYPEAVTRRPTVSVGVHVIDGNHEVTVFEAKKLANAAKDVAKAAGRDRVCFSSDVQRSFAGTGDVPEVRLGSPQASIVSPVWRRPI